MLKRFDGFVVVQTTFLDLLFFFPLLLSRLFEIKLIKINLKQKNSLDHQKNMTTHFF